MLRNSDSVSKQNQGLILAITLQSGWARLSHPQQIDVLIDTAFVDGSHTEFSC